MILDFTSKFRLGRITLNTGNFILALYTVQYGPAYLILELTLSHLQKYLLNAHAGLFSGFTGLNFGLSLHLYPYFFVCEQCRLWQYCAHVQARLSLTDLPLQY